MILGTLQTFEGFAVIKSELLTGYRSKTPISIGRTPRRSSIPFFQRLLPQWHAVTGSNCGGLGFFCKVSGRPDRTKSSHRGFGFG